MPHPFGFIEGGVSFAEANDRTLPITNTIHLDHHLSPNYGSDPSDIPIDYTSAMSGGLKRYQQTGDLHFVTFSCVRHRAILGTPKARDTLCQIVEETRERYRFHVLGYVIMPEHVHLLVTEPEVRLLATPLQFIKQRFSRTRPEEYVWEPRYYDFNVYAEDKRVEKLRYIHRNPVTRGLVADPAAWRWSSYCFYASNQAGPIRITS